MSSSDGRSTEGVGRLLQGPRPAGPSRARPRPPSPLASAPVRPVADPATRVGADGAGSPTSGAPRLEIDDLVRLRRAAERRGYAEGLARARRDLEAALEAAGALAAELERVAPTEIRHLARTVVALGVEVARQVLGTELRIDPTLLVRAVEDAVREVNGSPTARILLHPDAVGPVRAAWEALHSSTYLGKRWVFEADASLPVGGCRVHFDHGFVDASPEAQVAEVAAALQRALAAAVEASTSVVLRAAAGGRGESRDGDLVPPEVAP